MLTWDYNVEWLFGEKKKIVHTTMTIPGKKKKHEEVEVEPHLKNLWFFNSSFYELFD